MNPKHEVHESHTHSHGEGCGHLAVNHDGHTDYVHDGHLHHPHGNHVDEHRFEVSSTNPEDCTPEHNCGEHNRTHKHGPGCGHPAVPHGDHTDYLVGSHLHHPDRGHCDDHGVVNMASQTK